MTELLERWRSHQPALCGLTHPDHSQRWVRHSGQRWYFFEHDPASYADILAAVLEAIEAQEGTWDYRLAWRMAPTGEHFGVVRVTREDGWEKSWSCYAKSPAAALLTAYLAALEAEASQ